MPLKTLVKVGGITNLSDARYCAGMGVDMLGFSVIEGNDTYISPKLYQEIRGWVSGPKVVAELYGFSGGNLEKIIEQYAPDFIELSWNEYQRLKDITTLRAIVYLNRDELNHLVDHDKNIAYWIVDDIPHDAVQAYTPVLLKTTSKESLNENLSRPIITGLALTGSPELRPGFKNYDELADVLEALDE
jgi:phosphoribosylanthranilate isomerase